MGSVGVTGIINIKLNYTHLLSEPPSKFHLNIGQMRYFLRILESHLIIILIFYWIISPAVVYSTVSIVMIGYCKKNSKVIHQSINIQHIIVDSFFLHHHWQL